MSLRSDRLEVGLPTDRRRFVRNAAATALAVTVAPPLVGSAHAQDGPPSLGGSNTFTGNQLYQNSSDAPAITIDNQNPANATSTGSGGAVDVVDFGTSQPTVGLTKRVAPTAASPLLALRNLTGTTGPLITVGDANAIPVPNLAIDEFGQMRWATSGNPSDLAVGRSATGALRIDGAFELVAPPDRRGAVASISTPFNGLLISHANDLDGATYDLVGLFLKSCGDAVFVAHQGGEPPGFSGIAGGDAAFNCLIPYNLDGPFTGREGSILNTHQGMKGLFVQAQPNLDRVFCVYLQNWSNEAAVTIDNQNPAHPQGSGGGIAISDYGANKAAVTLSKLVTPSARSPLLRLSNVSGGSGVLLTVGNTPTRNNLTIDDTGALRWASQGNPSDLAMYRVRAGVLRLDGAIELSASSGGYVPPLGLGAPAANTLSFHTAGSERIRVTPTGGVGIGGITPFGGRLLQVGESVAGVSNSLSLQNYHQADGDSVQIEMVDNNRQFATVRGIFTSSANAGALSFQVRDASANALQERLRLSGLGIGFFGSAPAGRPVVSGARGGNAALSSLLRALASLGLITDSTTS